MPKTRTLRAALALSAALLAAPVLAQNSGAGSSGPATAAPPAGTTGTGQREVTSTGATVPNPGTAKTGPETNRERQAQERSDRVTRSICTGC